MKNKIINYFASLTNKTSSYKDIEQNLNFASLETTSKPIANKKKFALSLIISSICLTSIAAAIAIPIFYKNLSNTLSLKPAYEELIELPSLTSSSGYMDGLDAILHHI